MNKIYILFTLCFIWIGTIQTNAQNAITFTATASDTSPAVGDIITVTVMTGEGFDNLLGAQFGLNYNGAALSYVPGSEVIVAAAPLDQWQVNKRPNKSELVNVWVHLGFAGITVPPNTPIYTVDFEVLSTMGNSIDILCGEGEAGCEFVDGSLMTFSSVSLDPVLDINGGGDSQNLGPVIVDISNEQATTGESVCVSFAVSDFVDILSAQFSVQYDSTVLSFIGPLQTGPGIPSDNENPLGLSLGNFNDFAPGTITFSFSDFGGAAFTLADGTVIMDLCFDVLGAGGTSSDITIDSNPTLIQVIKNGEGNTNFGVITNPGVVDVTGSGGALDVVAYSIGNASGDEGANVCVPVTVDEGFDDILGFAWSIDYDDSIIDFTAIQNVHPSISSLSTNEVSSGNLSFFWTAPFAANSEVTLPNGTVLYEMCFDVTGNSGQIGAINFSDNPNPIETVKVDGPDSDMDQDLTIVNTTDGAVTVSNSDGLNLIVCDVDACPGDQLCLPILATGATEIASLSFTLQYDPTVLSFTGTNPETTPGAVQSFEPPTNLGNVNVIFFPFDGSTLTLQDCEIFGEFCFDVTGAQGTSSSVVIGNEPTVFQASILVDGLPVEIEIAASNGTVNVECSGTPGAPVSNCVCGAQTEDLVINESDSDVNNITCNGDQDGSIALSVSGGEEPLTFNWTNGATTQDISDLGPGLFTVEVTDADGNIATASFTIDEPSVLQPNSTATNTTTQNSNDGIITLNVTGGIEPYTYDWEDGQTTATITDLAPGLYNVTVTDANGCTIVTSRSIGAALTLQDAVITDVVCFGENTGSIDITLSGGVAPLSFSWDNNINQEDQFGLAAGTYCVTVVDTNGDSVNDCFTVTGPAATLDIITVSETPQSIPGANDGAIDIDVQGGEGAFTYVWNGPGINNVTTQDISSLTEGTYTVQVTDERGCVRTRTFFIGTAGTSLVIDPNSSQVASIACFGDNNGAINPAVSGGLLPYTFAWTGPGNFFANTLNISDLAPGTYQLAVTDANGTTVESVPFLITQPASPLSTTGQAIDESSPGTNDGGVNLDVSGGTPGYSFIWSNGFTTEDIFGLAMGTYTVTITDSRGCTFIDSYVVGTNADPLVIDALASTVVNVRCFGDSNGSISADVNGGIQPYIYNWDNGETTATISNLLAGEYTLTVTDQGGQTAIQTFIVISPSALDINVISTTSETGNGNDGSINILVTGGTPGYAYSWSGPNGFSSTSEDLSNLSEGLYTVNVFDTNGCVATRDILLGAVLSIENKFEIDVDCFGECTGEIDIVVIGGRPPYLYSWSGPDNFTATTQDINELCAGIYEVTITDVSGQSIFETCRIDEPLLGLTIGANPTIVNEVVPNFGSINITVSGGTAPYTYQWSNQATSEDITNLEAGSYRVTVTDANDCFIISPEYEVERVATPINIEMLTTNTPTCAGDCDGSVIVQIQGGDAPYDLVWNDGVTQTLSTTNPTYTREDMCADEYTLTITDANGQILEVPITLEDVDPILIDDIITPETMGMDGAINTTVTGGQPPYSYNWSPSGLPSTPDQENLNAGLYIVTVTDANDCEEIASFIVPDEIGPLVIEPNATINQIDCNGDTNGSINITVSGGVPPYSYQWNDPQSQTTEDAIGLGAGMYTVTVTDNDGNQVVSIVYVIEDRDPISGVVELNTFPNAGSNDGSAEVVDLTGGVAPYTFQWESGETTQLAANLNEGVQNVTIEDAFGCILILEFSLIDDVQPLSVSIGEQNNVSCNGDADGLICLAISGGIAPYDIIWSTGETTQCIGGLLAGEYSYTVTDSQNTAIENTQIIEITEPDPLEITFDVVPPSGPLSADGSAEAIVTGGNAPFTYQWNNPTGGGCNTPLCEDLLAGTYFVVVQDANECIIVDSVGVNNQFGGECLETRNIITPGDADGRNDTFLIQCAPGSINTLEIYNRFGQLVFITDNYDNTWAGTDRRGNLLPAGGYFYVFLLEDASTGETVPFQGHITILRQ